MFLLILNLMAATCFKQGVKGASSNVCLSQEHGCWQIRFISRWLHSVIHRITTSFEILVANNELFLKLMKDLRIECVVCGTFFFLSVPKLDLTRKTAEQCIIYSASQALRKVCAWRYRSSLAELYWNKSKPYPSHHPPPPNQCHLFPAPNAWPTGGVYLYVSVFIYRDKVSWEHVAFLFASFERLYSVEALM